MKIKNPDKAEEMSGTHTMQTQTELVALNDTNSCKNQKNLEGQCDYVAEIDESAEVNNSCEHSNFD